MMEVGEVHDVELEEQEPSAEPGSESNLSGHLESSRAGINVFDLRSRRWQEQAAGPGDMTFGNEVQVALNVAPNLVASRLSEKTKKVYNEKYQLLVRFAASMDPPVNINVSVQAAPPQVVIAYFRAMAFGKMSPVKDTQGDPILTVDGVPRLGGGWGYETFRSSFHALKIIHRIFHGDSPYEVTSSGRVVGNPFMISEQLLLFGLRNTTQEVYRSILRGVTRPDFCASHGRQVVLPESARRFSIPDLVKIHDYVMHNATDENIRSWAYIIVSIGLFLRQDEAANLLLSNITPATDPNTGMPIMTTEGLPHCLVVTITRDKTNKDGPGRKLFLRRNVKNLHLCPVIALLTWLSILREKHKYTRGYVFTSLRKGQLNSSLSAPHFLQIVKGLAKDSDLPHWNEYGTHSMRHTAAYFASWIGVPPETIQILGRWNSTVYFTYVKSADKDKRDWTSLNVENAADPVERNMDIFGSARS